MIHDRIAIRGPAIGFASWLLSSLILAATVLTGVDLAAPASAGEHSA